MNTFIGIGRLTKDPEYRVSSSGAEVAKFSLAIDRGKKDGKDLGADFIPVTCFGKTANIVDKYCKKGKQICVSGRIQTGSYEKDGKRVYTTDILADRIEFLDSVDNTDNLREASALNEKAGKDDIPSGFNAIDDLDIPF